MAKLHPLFEKMDVDAEVKAELSEAFETAVLEEVTNKMDEYVDSKLTEETLRLQEDYKEKVEYLTEALDGYMETVIEEFIEDNKPSYEAQIDEEKTKTLLSTFDNMVKVLGVDMMTIAEAKDEKDNEGFEAQVGKLETEISQMTDKLIEARRESEKYLKAGLITEMCADLTVLETEKFEKLSEMVQFEKDISYVQKLETIKESILSDRSEDFVEERAKLSDKAFKSIDKPTVDQALDFSAYI